MPKQPVTTHTAAINLTAIPNVSAAALRVFLYIYTYKDPHTLRSVPRAIGKRGAKTAIKELERLGLIYITGGDSLINTTNMGWDVFYSMGFKGFRSKQYTGGYNG